MRDAPVKTSGYLQGINIVSTSIKERIGTLRILEDGRKFRYAKAGAALTAGQMAKMPAIPAAHIDGAIASSNTSGNQVEVTVTAGTTLANDALAGGYLQVNDGTLEGRSYRIDSSTALTAAGTSITISMVDRLVDYDGTTQVTLFANPWSGVLVGTAASAPAGITPVAVASGSYFWAQVSGPANALMSGTPAAGAALILGAAGALATGAAEGFVVGFMHGTAGVDGEYKPVILTMS